MFNRSLYTALLYITSPLIFSLLLKTKKGKPPIGERWKEFVGISPALPAANQQPIWIHAVSVGEVIAATPIINALQAKYPHQQLLITTTTSTGAERVAALSGNIEHRYFPADYPFAVKQFITRMKPSICLIMETELWPNMLNICQQAQLPTVVVNARLSAKSQQKYLKFKSLFAQPLQTIEHILCQNEDDKQRFIELDIAADNISVTGTVKYDIQFNESIINAGLALKTALGDRSTLIAASTHKGEDEQVLAAFAQIKQQHANAVMILVPRHPERFDSVASLCQQHFAHTVRRSQNPTAAELIQAAVYLADSMGEMPIMLAASDVCFMGGSLLGDKVGGHNLLEPAALAKPCITGPSYFNFADVTAQLLQHNAVTVVQDEDELAKTVTALFHDQKAAIAMGNNAKAVVAANAGALDKIINKLSVFLDVIVDKDKNNSH